MHIGRVHDKTIPTFTGHKALALAKPRAVQLENHADHEEATAGGTAIATRTTRVRRAEEVTVTEQVQHSAFQVNGCPHCRFPIGVMHKDLERRNIALPPYCPQCTCPISPVKSALKLINRQPSVALVPA